MSRQQSVVFAACLLWGLLVLPAPDVLALTCVNGTRLYVDNGTHWIGYLPANLSPNTVNKTECAPGVGFCMRRRTRPDLNKQKFLNEWGCEDKAIAKKTRCAKRVGELTCTFTASKPGAPSNDVYSCCCAADECNTLEGLKAQTFIPAAAGSGTARQSGHSRGQSNHHYHYDSRGRHLIQTNHLSNSEPEPKRLRNHPIKRNDVRHDARKPGKNIDDMDWVRIADKDMFD